MKFDMSEAWRDASAMLSANREVLLVVAGIFFLLPNLLLTLNMPDLTGMAMEDPQAVERAMLEMYGAVWWVLALVILGSMVGSLALLALLRDTSRPTVGQALRVGLVGLLPAIGVYILFVLGASLVLGIPYGIAAAIKVSAVDAVASIAVILGLIYLSMRASLTAPVIAIEKRYNPIKVLGRSWQLTKGNSVRLFLFFLLIFIVYIVIAMLAGVVLGLLMILLGDEAFKVLNAIVTGILSTVVGVVVVAVLAAAHRQLAGETAEPPGHTPN